MYKMKIIIKLKKKKILKTTFILSTIDVLVE